MVGPNLSGSPFANFFAKTGIHLCAPSRVPGAPFWLAVLTPQDGGLKAISKKHLFRDMMRGSARQKEKSFFRNVLSFIACCVWALFWFDVLMSITNDPGYSSISPELAFLLCMLTMAVLPLGFLAARLSR